MSNLGTLYRYELKKITMRKILWITLLICILGIGVTVLSGLLGSYYVDGKIVDTHYNMFLVDREYRENLSGRVIGQELLQEMTNAYGKIPSTVERYTLTEEYQTYARPYSDIFNIVRSWTNMNAAAVMNWEPDEEALYAARHSRIEYDWQAQLLSEAEKTSWREKEQQLETPFTYYYHEGYGIALDAFETIGVLMLLFVSICLSSVFPEEHTRRTDQLMLSSVNGKNSVYWAKILTGITVAVTCATLMTLITIGLALGVFGAEGFHTALQVSFGTYSYPLTIGQACLIAYGILIITSILVSVFVMVLSELLHSNIATLAVAAGLVILGMMFNIPEQYRIIGQIWDYLPMTFLSTWNIFDTRLITILGQCFVSWQIVPIIYILCGIVLAVAGKRLYQRYI